MITNETIRIAIADAQTSFRSNIVTNICEWQSFNVVIESDNGIDLLHAIEITEQQPHICLLDVTLPLLNGYDTLMKLKKRWPYIKALICTHCIEEKSIAEMVKNGAGGYLQKGCSLTELKKAIISIHETGYYYSELVSIDILSRAHKYEERHTMLSNIPARELEFLGYCVEEMNYREIANKMNISENTVKTYRDNLFERFGINSKTGLAVFALRTGLVPLNMRRSPKPHYTQPSFLYPS